MGDDNQEWIDLVKSVAAQAAPGANKGPEARAAASGAGMRPAPAPDTDIQMAPGQRGIPFNPIPHATERSRAEDPVAHDPLAQGVLAGVVGGGAGTLAGEAAGALGATASRIAAGGAGGAVANKMQGGSAVTGAVLGAALPATGAAISKAKSMAGAGAAESQINRVVGESQAMGTRGQGGKIELSKPAIGEVLSKDPQLAGQLAKAVKNPVEFKRVLSTSKDATGEEIGAAYKSADSVALGVPVADVRRSLRLAQRMYNNPVDKPLKDQLERTVNNFEEQFGADGRVPLSKLWETRTALQKRGFSGPQSNPSIPKELQRDAAEALQRALDKRIDEITSLAQGVRGNTAVAGSAPLQGYAASAKALEALPQLNQRFAALSRLHDAAERAAESPPPVSEGVVSDLLHHGKAKSVGALVGGAVGHHVAGAPGAVAGAFVGGKVGQVASGLGTSTVDALARLHAARVAGAVTPQVLQETLAAGVPASVMYHALGDRQNGAMAVQREAFAQ